MNVCPNCGVKWVGYAGHRSSVAVSNLIGCYTACGSGPYLVDEGNLGRDKPRMEIGKEKTPDLNKETEG